MSKKGGFLTPKAISNRIKAKGLQKLRWFCQMCQKQCRDENGFKCHLTSESHQRQLLLFAEDPDQYIDQFSEDFKSDFLELLRRRFGTKRVQANVVYQEYIANKEHTHMNSTQWETLTDFVKWSGKEGICVVDQTEKGWFIQYIDRDWEAIQKQESVRKKEKMDLDDDERIAKFVEKQIERAGGVLEADNAATELTRDSEDQKVEFSLAMAAKMTEKIAASKVLPKSALGSDKNIDSSKPAAKTSMAGQKRKSALDDIMMMEEQKKEKQNRKENWLHTGIVVKVVTKRLGDKFYKKKAFIKEVQNDFAAVIKMLDTGEKVKVDQAHLETVIPALGKSVMIVNGAYRGQEATLLELNEKKFCCSVKISSGPLSGRRVDKVQYEDISKLYNPS